MEYNKLVSVTGLSGLFELVSSKPDGALVRSLEDKSTKFVSSRVHNFAHLESIEVFTTAENINLSEVFVAMKSSSVKKLPDASDAKAVKEYFTKVYPNMDFSRVYASDMKKMIKWYEVLGKNNIEIKLTEHSDVENVEITAKPKATAAVTKSAAINNAPTRKINTPRKMA